MSNFLNWKDWLLLKESNKKRKKKNKKKKKSNIRFGWWGCGSCNNHNKNDQNNNASNDNIDIEVGDSTETSDGGVSVGESKKSIKIPNYSFDKWLQRVQDLSGNVEKIIEKGNSKEKEILNKIKSLIKKHKDEEDKHKDKDEEDKHKDKDEEDKHKDKDEDEKN